MRYVAFLRAINVGGHVVKMEDLRAIFSAEKLENVATFIASGNVLFDSKASAAVLETKLERALEQSLHYPVATFLRTMEELRAVAEYEPFRVTDGKLYVGFLKQAPPRDAAKKIVAMTSDLDLLHVHSREIYWLSRTAFGATSVSAAAMEKIVGPATFRNINTPRKIVAKFSSK